MKKYFILLVFLFLNSLQSFSQNEHKVFDSFQTDFFIGKPIEHDKKLDNAIQGNSYGLLLSWNKKNENPTDY